MTALVCARCGANLEDTYHHDTVVGQRRVATLGADGGTMHAGVVEATIACSWTCLAVLAALRAGSDADAAVLVVAERERQVTAEGYSPEHDEDHEPGELAAAGICYAWDHASEDSDRWRTAPGPPTAWPWEADWWKPKNPLRDLVRAGALIAAEADRHVRARRLGDQL